MSKTIAPLAAAAVVVCGLAGSAGAVNMPTVCQASPCLYDQNNLIFGVPRDNNTMWRRIAGNWYSMRYSLEFGFYDNLILNYTAANCAGQPYIFTENKIDGVITVELSPRAASYDRFTKTIWYPVGHQAVIQPQSFYFMGSCTNGVWGPPSQFDAPAVSLQAPPLAPPLTIR